MIFDVIYNLNNTQVYRNFVYHSIIALNKIQLNFCHRKCFFVFNMGKIAECLLLRSSFEKKAASKK